jgi:hypothetical protein
MAGNKHSTTTLPRMGRRSNIRDFPDRILCPLPQRMRGPSIAAWWHPPRAAARPSPIPGSLQGFDRLRQVRLGVSKCSVAPEGMDHRRRNGGGMAQQGLCAPASAVRTKCPYFVDPQSIQNQQRAVLSAGSQVKSLRAIGTRWLQGNP